MLLPFLSLFFTAFALLEYEILLMRVLSIQQWSHYAYMVVSLAMLGLGSSGVIIALFPDFIRRNGRRLITLSCFLFSLSAPVAFYLNRLLPLDTLYLLWDWRQFLYLGISYFLYGVPFLFASLALGLFFLLFPGKTGWVYGGNLLGSGMGILLSLGIMHLSPPESYLAIVGISAAFAGFLWGITPWRKKNVVLMLSLFIVFLGMHYFLQPSSLQMSPYKELTGFLRMPGVRVTHRLYSPLGILHILEGKTIRIAPGLSINFTGKLPPQKAITIDGTSPTAVTRYQGNNQGLEFLDKRVLAAPYHLMERPRVLIIGAGGGDDILLANYHKASSITAIEMNPQMVFAVENILGDFSGHLYTRPGTRVVIKEARGYIQEYPGQFDLIQLNLQGSFLTSSAGVYAQNEDYLHTVEALRTFYHKLSPEGILTITRWMKTPARDGIKTFATAVVALEEEKVKDPGRQLALIRNWDTITLLLKRSPFTEEELQRLREFCRERNFDISYLPGIKREEVNRYNILPEPSYYQAAVKILNPLTRERFYATYPFQVKPPTDDKPYFSNFFHWAALLPLIRTMGREWVPFAEYGYLVLLATFIAALITGSLLILLPLGWLVKRRRGKRKSLKGRVGLYFFLLGFSYLLLEMALIQKFILFLHHPVYSIVIVITAFLLCSGGGSLVSHRFSWGRGRKRVIIPFLAILTFGLLYVFSLSPLFRLFSWAPTYLRLGITFVIIGPLAFFMGMPFPLGMERVVWKGEKETGIAWGLNGFASVMGAVSAPLLASLWGFRSLGLLSSGAYLLALGILLEKWEV